MNVDALGLTILENTERPEWVRLTRPTLDHVAGAVVPVDHWDQTPYVLPARTYGWSSPTPLLFDEWEPADPPVQPEPAATPPEVQVVSHRFPPAIGQPGAPKPFGPPSAKSQAAVEAVIAETYERMQADAAVLAEEGRDEPADYEALKYGSEPAPPKPTHERSDAVKALAVRIHEYCTTSISYDTWTKRDVATEAVRIAMEDAWHEVEKIAVMDREPVPSPVDPPQPDRRAMARHVLDELAAVAWKAALGDSAAVAIDSRSLVGQESMLAAIQAVLAAVGDVDPPAETVSDTVTIEVPRTWAAYGAGRGVGGFPADERVREACRAATGVKP